MQHKRRPLARCLWAGILSLRLGSLRHGYRAPNHVVLGFSTGVGSLTPFHNSYPSIKVLDQALLTVDNEVPIVTTGHIPIRTYLF